MTTSTLPIDPLKLRHDLSSAVGALQIISEMLSRGNPKEIPDIDGLTGKCLVRLKGILDYLDSSRGTTLASRTRGKPIVYTDTIKTRFNDLDPYGHVNASVYLDYIISSRWNHLKKSMGLTSDDLIKKGVGFFLLESHINYRNPLKGVAEVTVRSWVSSIEDTFLIVEFVIEREDSTVVSDGELKFAIMNLMTGHMQTCPIEVKRLFWEELV